MINLVSSTKVSIVGARLDRLPAGRFHRRILWLIGLGMFFDAFDIYLAGGVLGALVKSGWSNVHSNATFISATFIGLFLGALTAGIVADHFGRKMSYQINLLIFGLASIAGALSPNMTFLIFARAVMGIGLGAEIVIGYATFSEFVPAETRGKWVSSLAIITNVGLAASALVGFLVIPTVGWRWMFVIVGVGALVIWYMRRVLPESPRWHESNGRVEEAEKIVASIEKEIEAEKGITLPALELPRPSGDHETYSFWSLLRPGLLKRTVLACLILIVLNTVIYAFIAWVPTIFIKEGINVSKSLGYTAIMMIGGPLGAFLGSIIYDRVGRRYSSAALFILAALLGIGYGLATNLAVVLVIGFCLTTILYILVAFGFGIYPAELFPTQVRFRGVGTANSIGRLATIFSPYGVALLLTGYGFRSVFYAIAALLIFMGIVFALFGIETKKQPLEKTSLI